MAGIIRLSNTGTGNGQSTITTAASGDTTYTLPSGGGTFVTTSSTQALTVPFASGTVSAPSITFLGDSNTGIYSPAADTIAFTEGGVESLRIDSSGRVGIGTTSPGAKLVVSDTAALVAAFGRTGSAGSQIALTDSISSVGIGCSSGALTFGANGYETERARIDSSGRLLVGTSTSAVSYSDWRLQISGQAALGSYLGATTSAYNFNFIKSRSSSVGTYTIVASGDKIGGISFNGDDGTDYETPAASIEAFVDGTPGANDMPGRLVFSTTADGASSPTERMRINNKGFLKVSNTGVYESDSNAEHQIRSNTDNSVALRIDHRGTSTFQYGLYIGTGNDQNNSTNYFFSCYGASTERATMRSNGGLANYSANNVNLSDINTKKDISPVTNTWDCIKEWEIVNYRYKDQPDDADLNLGVIAQQVAKSCPEVITVFSEAKDAKPAVLDDEGNEVEPAQEAQPEKLGVKEQQMYWMAIKALQEAQVRIEALEAEVAALKAQ